MPTEELATVSNAVRLLSEYSTAEPLIGTSDLARRLRLSKSTTNRLVLTLARQGLLQRDDDGRYRLGLKLFELASLVPASLELREIALPYLRQLGQSTQETVHLAVREGLEMVYIEKLEPNRSVRMYSRVGRRAPMYCTGVGKAVLALEDERVLQEVLNGQLPAFTRHTIVDRDELVRELESVRRNGYALDREEIEDGLRCVAVAVRDYSGRVLGGMSVAGPRQRMTPDRVRQLIPLVVSAAGQVSARLGFSAAAGPIEQTGPRRP